MDTVTQNIILFYIIASIVSIGFAIFFASKFAEIAEMKGHSGKAYFWYVFLFGIIGMIMVAALPNNNQPEGMQANTMLHIDKNISAENDSEPEVKYLKCSSCGKEITHYPCEHCGYTLEKKDAPYWCGKCGYLGPFADKCPQCGSGIKIINTTKS